MERKNKTWEGKKKEREKRKRTQKGGIFLLSIGDKREILTYIQYNKLFDET